jgi:hypothetical protein
MYVEELLLCFVFYIILKIDYVRDNSKNLQMIHLFVNALSKSSHILLKIVRQSLEKKLRLCV